MTKSKGNRGKTRTPTRRLHIPITAEIINTAVERDSAHCVLADAVSAALPGVKRVTVDLQTIRFTTEDGTRYVYLTPAPAQELLVKFDQGVKPDPGTMYLDRPIVRTAPRDRAKTAVEIQDAKGHRGTQVTVTGGKLPPTAALSNRRGRRRSYGLRQLKP